MEILKIGHVLGRVRRNIAPVAIVGVDVPNHDDIALQACIVVVLGAPVAIGVDISPIGINRVAIVFGIGFFQRSQVCDGVRGWRQALHVTQRLVVQLAHRVISFVSARLRTCAPELIKVIDHHAYPKGGVTFRVGRENTCIVVPFCLGVAASFFTAINIKLLLAHILHGRAQHAAISAAAVTCSLVHQITKSCQADLVGVFLNHTRGLVITVRILLAKTIIAHVFQHITIRLAHLNARVEKPV